MSIDSVHVSPRARVWCEGVGSYLSIAPTGDLVLECRDTFRLWLTALVHDVRLATQSGRSDVHD
jgi:hypothetical protein